MSMTVLSKRLLGQCLRETGQALDRFGLNCVDSILVHETFSRHRQLMPLVEHAPKLADSAWVAPSAAVVGEVDISSRASVWYGAVVRGDYGPVTIGQGTNVQDDAVLCAGTVTIGEGSTIGYGAIVKDSKIGNLSMVGMKAILEGSEVGNGSIVQAGAVVPSGSKIGEGEVWGGNPAKYIRQVSLEDRAQLEKNAKDHTELAQEHAAAIEA